MIKNSEPVYCTPEDVAETLDLPDPNDNYGTMMFSEMSHPSYSRVCKMIKSNEDIIDRTVRRSWKENRVVDQVLTINTYWHDINGWRQDYYTEGGNYVQLRKDVLPWDPSKGDKLEFKTRSNTWVDVSGMTEMTHVNVTDPTKGAQWAEAGTRYSFWFDYHLGKLYLRTSMFQNLAHSLRITYRYGAEVPYITLYEDDFWKWTKGEDGEYHWETTDPPKPTDTAPELVETEHDEGTEEGYPLILDPQEDVIYHTPAIYETDADGNVLVDRDKLEVPSGINRMCCLMTAIQVLSMQFFNVKVGAGGDIGNARDSTIKMWQDEINMLKTSYQRAGPVRSLYR